MEKNVEFIDVSKNHKCYKCSGIGRLPEALDGLEDPADPCGIICNTCKGTGKYKEEFYHLITTTPSGKKIAFGVDQAGK